MSIIIGFSNTHNGSVALICDGEVKVAIQAERISRKKRQSLPLGKEIELTHKCVQYCLNSLGLKYKDVNAIALSTPWKVQKISNERLFQYIENRSLMVVKWLDLLLHNQLMKFRHN